MAKLIITLGSILLLATIANCANNTGAAGNESNSNEDPQFIPYNCNAHLSPDHFTENKNGIVREDHRWPRGVMPIVYDSSVTEKQKEIIKEGIALINDTTCLKIVDKTDEVVFVTIFADKADGGCDSNGVGMRGTGTQKIHLQPIGCMYPGTVAHELLHAMGLWHEHARPDRNLYIEVITDNIKEDMQDQFQLCSKNVAEDECSTYGVPYNVWSIMHYAAYSGAAKNKTEPIMKSLEGFEAIPKSNLDYTKLTDDDVTKLHIMYNNCQPFTH